MESVHREGMHKLQFMCLHLGHITCAPDLDFVVIFLSLLVQMSGDYLWMGIDLMFSDPYLLTVYDHLQIPFKVIQSLKLEKCCFTED